MPDPLIIPISTPADISGAKAVASSLGEVHEATERVNATTAKASPLNKAFQDGLNKTADGARKTKESTLSAAETFEKLNSASNLGVGGILNLGRALKGLGAAFAANPILAGISAFLLLKDAAGAAGRVLGDVIVRARSTADEFKAIARVDLTKTLTDIKTSGDKALVKISKDAKTAADDIARLNAGTAEAAGRFDALADAALKAKLAELALAEAKALAGATTDDQRAAITADFAGQRTKAQRAGQAKSFERTQRFEKDRIAEADRLQGSSRDRVDTASGRVVTTQRQLDDALARGRTQRADSPEGKQTTNDIIVLRAELKALTEQLAKVREEEGKNIEAASRTKREAETALEVNRLNASAQYTTNRVEDLSQATQRTNDTGVKAARSVLGKIRNPAAGGDLNAEQEQQVLGRALEINKNALAQEGRQAGETIGEAVALALREAFPQLTNEIARTVRIAVDREVKAATASLKGKVDSLGR